jgi:hypothetical protein
MDEELTKEALFFFVMFVVAAVLVNLTIYVVWFTP